MSNQTITACLIVKNEEKYIRMCIDSLWDVVDGITVVDTGSTDKTVDILKEYDSAKLTLKTVVWKDDFSAARNEAIKDIRSRWILVLDGDEKLVCNKETLHNFLKNSKEESYNIPILNYVSDALPFVVASMPRLFKNDKPYYNGAVHEQIYLNGEQKRSVPIPQSVALIHHYGYLDENFEIKRRGERNKNILFYEISRSPDVGTNWMYLGNEYLKEEQYEKAIEAYTECLLRLKGNETSYMPFVLTDMAFAYLKSGKIEALEEHLSRYKDIRGFSSTAEYDYCLAKTYEARKRYENAIDLYLKMMNGQQETDNMQTIGANSILPCFEIAKLYFSSILNMEKGAYYYLEGLFVRENQGYWGLKDILSTFRHHGMKGEADCLEAQVAVLKAERKVPKGEAQALASEIYQVILGEISQGNYRAADSIIKEYESIVPADPKLFEAKGIVALSMGKNFEACLNFHLHLRYNNPTADSYYNMAFFNEQVGLNERAKYYYSLALPLCGVEEQTALIKKIKTL